MKRASSLLKPISIIPVSISVKMMLFGPECDLKTTIKTALATDEAGCIQTKRNRRYIATCPELSREGRLSLARSGCHSSMPRQLSRLNVGTRLLSPGEQTWPAFHNSRTSCSAMRCRSSSCLVNLRQRGFARRSLPNSPMTPPRRPRRSAPSQGSEAGRRKYDSRIRMSSVHSKLEARCFILVQS